MTSNDDMLAIGIDGGGTGCRVAMQLGTSSHVSEGAGGPANIMTDPEGAVQNVSTAVAELLSGTGLDGGALSRARIHLGLAGVVDDRHDEALAAAFPGAAVTVSDDRLTTLTGALGDIDGAVAGIGTGSFIGRRDGDSVRFVGGWGGIVGDQASGAWLGKRLLEETLKAHDGLIAPTALTAEVLDALSGPVGLVSFARNARPGAFATHAPRVVERQDDPLARSLFGEGAEYILSALRTLGAGPGERLVLTGGLGRFYKPYLPPEWQSGLAEPAGTALNGALRLAARSG